MLLDPETFDLVQHIETVLAATAGHELEGKIKAELMQSVLEIATWTASWRMPPVRVVFVISGVTVTVTVLPAAGDFVSTTW